jgi:hypothetical protein
MEPDQVLKRLDAIDERLSRIEQALPDIEALRSALQHERDSRASLADQTAWLIESLGEARLELRRVRDADSTT